MKPNPYTMHHTHPTARNQVAYSWQERFAKLLRMDRKMIADGVDMIDCGRLLELLKRKRNIKQGVIEREE